MFAPRATIQKWYKLQRWRNRAALQLSEHPLCKMCLDDGVVQAATVADHITPHRGNQWLFWFGELQSLCAEHHNSTKKQIEDKGYADDIGADGFPVDKKHPFNLLK